MAAQKSKRRDKSKHFFYPLVWNTLAMLHSNPSRCGLTDDGARSKTVGEPFHNRHAIQWNSQVTLPPEERVSTPT